jgi:hypothetical protein
LTISKTDVSGNDTKYLQFVNIRAHKSAFSHAEKPELGAAWLPVGAGKSPQITQTSPDTDRPGAAADRRDRVNDGRDGAISDQDGPGSG